MFVPFPRLDMEFQHYVMIFVFNDLM